MAQWAVILPGPQWATERLFHNEGLAVAGAAGAVAPDEEVLLVADGHVVALCRAAKTDGDDLVLTYLRRQFDAPVPAEGVGGAGPVEVDPEFFRRLVSQLSGANAAGLPSWLVSVALPIEAGSPADAVRQFWSHVRELGPAELPAYVWPSGDELAMLAFVLGAEANQDPEEEDED
ncbi:hypothetical protein [Paractinoplanes ferrugineus]|nr:hypothetical protein [Actinoplanes ferrugineus]